MMRNPPYCQRPNNLRSDMRVKLKLWSDLEVVDFEQVGLSKVVGTTLWEYQPVLSGGIGLRVGPPGGQVF